MNALSVIEAAYQQSREWHAWDSSPQQHAYDITRELVAAGLVTDDRIGEASIEARIDRVLTRLVGDYEGRAAADDVAAEVAYHLGLATHDEASNYAGREVAA